MKRYEPGPLLGSLSDSPMPIRSGAMQRPRGCRCGNTFRHRYDEVGLPCSSTDGIALSHLHVRHLAAEDTLPLLLIRKCCRNHIRFPSFSLLPDRKEKPCGELQACFLSSIPP